MAKILIIDDRPVNRQFLTTLLGYQHKDLREASDGAEGLRVAREQRPDLIISDVLMPTMDGYDFVRQLREEPEIGKTPVIFSTAHYLSREAQALAERCGVTSIIYKPCEPQVVLDTVTAALSGKAETEAEPAALPEAEEFDREHQRLLTNKLAEKTEQLRDAHGKLTALIELSTDLASERDPVELLDRYCSVAREVIGARWTLVVLLEPTRKTVQHLGVVGLELEDTPALRSALLETGIFRTVVTDGRTVCLSDVTSTAEALRLPRILPRAESLLVAPLSNREQVYGWICLADKLGLDAFSEQDERLALALAAKMAVAYDNACLYSDSVKYASKLETEISERTKVEHRLSENKARLAGIIDSAMDSIITVDVDQRIVLFNEAAEKMFRCTSAEVIGQTLDRFIPPHFRPSHSQDIRKFGETGVTTRAMGAARPISGLRSDGKEFPAEASISQIDVSGQKLFTVIMRDVTEKSRAQEALRASEIRYRRLFESAKDGILILEADSGQIVDVNPYLIEMLGYPKEDLVGKELWEIGIFKDIVASKAAFVELQQEGYIRYENLPLETRGGVIKQVGFVSNSYLANGSRVIQCNIRDITARKLAEKELRDTNQRLEQALSDLHSKQDELTSMTQQLWQASKLATMGELAASVAHELNNPLATVGLRTESLLMQMPDEADKRKPLEIIQQEVDRMATLVNNLLQFSRRSHRQISTVDPCEEIATSVEFVNYHLRSHNIEVVREFADSLPTIQADRQQLRQLFLNLLTNASDAMPQGGKLTARVAAGTLNDAEAVAIEFVDTGEGITAENLEKIWEPFFTTKPEGKGTGLGLAICRRIVEEHGGTISIQSEGVGRGTTIRIVFPATGNISSSLK
jgi:PAS domain S-box-containing protein